ncbi:TetR/AcrR family transcriptional regulator [Polaromonas sp.]|uniref:TetR/AcrR family transcriptional regulator n=1 Tax=Polaromonas sp. TaxID=1869339 RepID=UPI00286BE638|nr:TetR/AcrR family transcriptional regulator [Polaromonas sp.]
MPSIRKNPETSRAVKTDADSTRRRLTPADRERQIVAGAVSFFSEHGLNGQLRDLARQLGITHTLLYHYFPTKQALIERVYAEMFEGRWKPEWETLLDDKALDVETKLTRFYSDYAKVILQSDWVRIFVFSGLSDRYITDRYFSLLREKLFPRLVRETRKYRGLVSRSKPTGRELELLLGLHGNIFYMGIRRWIYGQAVHDVQSVVMDDDVEHYIHDKVLAYLLSVGPVLDRKPTKMKV